MLVPYHKGFFIYTYPPPPPPPTTTHILSTINALKYLTKSGKWSYQGRYHDHILWKYKIIHLHKNKTKAVERKPTPQADYLLMWLCCMCDEATNAHLATCMWQHEPPSLPPTITTSHPNIQCSQSEHHGTLSYSYFLRESNDSPCESNHSTHEIYTPHRLNLANVQTTSFHRKKERSPKKKDKKKKKKADDSPRSAASNDGNLLPSGHAERHPPQNRLSRDVLKVHIFKGNGGCWGVDLQHGRSNIALASQTQAEFMWWRYQHSTSLSWTRTSWIRVMTRVLRLSAFSVTILNTHKLNSCDDACVKAISIQRHRHEHTQAEFMWWHMC